VDGMLTRKYSPERIGKLLGGNFIRVLKEVWK
jgi:microsomal dipeptidase-like Zn-dependent dipeptidase